MRLTDTIPQVDGIRHVYRCPRGTIAIDDLGGNGKLEITRCLGGAAITLRDMREALALHRALTADEKRTVEG